MPKEIVLFDLHNVLITNRRFTVGQRSFSLHSIRSLHFLEHGRSWRPAAASASLSALSGLAAFTVGKPFLAVPAAGLSVLATALFIHGAPKYGIGLDTEDGYFIPLISRDRFLVEGVTRTLQSATQRFAVPVSPRADEAHMLSTSGLAATATLLPTTGHIRSIRPAAAQATIMPHSLPRAIPRQMQHRIHPV